MYVTHSTRARVRCLRINMSVWEPAASWFVSLRDPCLLCFLVWTHGKIKIIKRTRRLIVVHQIRNSSRYKGMKSGWSVEIVVHSKKSLFQQKFKEIVPFLEEFSMQECDLKNDPIGHPESDKKIRLAVLLGIRLHPKTSDSATLVGRQIFFSMLTRSLTVPHKKAFGAKQVWAVMACFASKNPFKLLTMWLFYAHQWSIGLDPDFNEFC